MPHECGPGFQRTTSDDKAFENSCCCRPSWAALVIVLASFFMPRSDDQDFVLLVICRSACVRCSIKSYCCMTNHSCLL